MSYIEDARCPKVKHYENLHMWVLSGRCESVLYKSGVHFARRLSFKSDRHSENPRSFPSQFSHCSRSSSWLVYSEIRTKPTFTALHKFQFEGIPLKSSAHIWLFVIYHPNIEIIFTPLGSRHSKFAPIWTVTNERPNVNPLRKLKQWIEDMWQTFFRISLCLLYVNE